ncbi:MAG: hypothetical protein H0W45_06340 [Acidobacteria bacterium]|jgi:hypothetical protein|nr:hypothetical protein [Acidobacteriota bacterium]
MKIIGYALCLNNDDYTVSLEVRKIYPILAPHDNDPNGYVRIIDESGEDYLYAENRFSPIKLSPKIRKQVEENLFAV